MCRQFFLLLAALAAPPRAKPILVYIVNNDFDDYVLQIYPLFHVLNGFFPLDFEERNFTCHLNFVVFFSRQLF